MSISRLLRIVLLAAFLWLTAGFVAADDENGEGHSWDERVGGRPPMNPKKPISPTYIYINVASWEIIFIVGDAPAVEGNVSYTGDSKKIIIKAR
ncbi:MAG: hypothetical protein L0Y74_00830 [candidate division Zixibacteria bacterium]|nr:hypothetical protein [candidate division Zixibacteria bacterium]